MGFDWDAIREQDSAEMAFYRLLGEMLQRRASRADLDRIRGFLGTIRPGPDAWHSLGEALFHTTGGSSDGFRLWCAWSRTLEETAFDESQHTAAWQRFRRDLSDVLAEDSDVGLAETTDASGPPTIQFEDFEEDITSTDATRVLDDRSNAPLVFESRAELISRMPSGPHTIRIAGEVYDSVDEFALVELLRRGAFLGLEILFGGRWLAVDEHPAFAAIINELHGEAHTVLASARRIRPEVTTPGTV